MNTLPRKNRHDGLRASQELTRPHSTEAQGWKSKNFFENTLWEHNATTERARELFYHAQPTMHSQDAVSTISEGLAPVLDDGRPWHQSHGAGSEEMKETGHNGS